MRLSLRNPFAQRGPIVPVVRLSGTIGATVPLRPGLSLAAVEQALDRAFSLKSAPAVAVVINSPGGAAAQSHLIYTRIRHLAEEKEKRVVVAVEDVAASGGYMIALAGDEIVVDGSSIIGSIGVVSAGFGFPRLLDRIGVERRIHAAGESKAMLDPFQPEKPEDVARLENLQRDVHAAFIDLVKSRRGERLGDDPDLFTGAFWSGERAVALGLADRVGDLRTVIRTEFGEKARLKLISAERGLLRRRLGLERNPDWSSPSMVADGILGAIDERLHWHRYGL